jgi:hypothetical protein
VPASLASSSAQFGTLARVAVFAELASRMMTFTRSPKSRSRATMAAMESPPTPWRSSQGTQGVDG